MAPREAASGARFVGLLAPDVTKSSIFMATLRARSAPQAGLTKTNQKPEEPKFSFGDSGERDDKGAQPSLFGRDSNQTLGPLRALEV